jgi:hypothetical protein
VGRYYYTAHEQPRKRQSMDLPFMKPPTLRSQETQEKRSKRSLPADERAPARVSCSPLASPKRRALEDTATNSSSSPRPAPAPAPAEPEQPDKIRRRARFLSEQSSGPDPELLDAESVPSLAAPSNPEADAYAKMAAQYLQIGGEENEQPARDAVSAGLLACPGHAECSTLLEVLDAQYGPAPDATNRGSLMMNDLQFSVHAPTDVEARWADELRAGNLSANRWRNMHSVLSERGWEKWGQDKRQAADAGERLVGQQVAVDGEGFGHVVSFERGKFSSKHRVLFSGDAVARDVKLLRKGLQWLARPTPQQEPAAAVANGAEDQEKAN